MSGAITAPTGALTPRQIAAYAAAAGFTGPALDTAVAVALAESSGIPSNLNTSNRDGSRDRGLWQINTVHGGTDQELFNPGTNASYAYRISNGGRDWSPWVAWKSNAHVQYLPQARAAVAELGATGGLPIQGVTGGIPDPFGWAGDKAAEEVDKAVGRIIEALAPVAMSTVFTVAALGLIALGLSRLTERTPTELFTTATKFTGAGGIAKAVV